MSSIPRTLWELQALVQWVNFIYLERGAEQTKPPMNPKIDGRRPLEERLARPNDPTTWATYQEALARWENTPSYKGLGFVFSANDPYTGIDLDKCRNKQTGEVQPWALRIIHLLNSYTEYSPSETGFHILVRANLHTVARTLARNKVQHKKGPIELYDRAHYFTITGKHVEGCPLTIENRQEQVTTLYAETFPEEEGRKVSHQETITPAYPSQSMRFTNRLSNEEILKRAPLARGSNGTRFQSLWNGDTHAYRDTNGNVDESRADLALLAILAYWTQKDAYQMETLFKQSGLYRPERWNQPARAGETYGQGSIRIAIANCRTTYNPAWIQEQQTSSAKTGVSATSAHKGGNTSWL